MDAESPGDDHAESPDEPLRLEFTNNELAAAMSTEMEDCVLESLKKLRDGEDRNEISSLIGHVESLRSIRRKASNRCFLNAAAVNATSVQIKSDALAMLRNYQREFAADKICGACDRELPNYSFSGEQWGRRTEHQEMQGVRRRGEATGADDEGPRKVGGRRLPDLQPAVVGRCEADSVPGVLHEENLHWLLIGSSQTRHVGLSILPDTIAKR